MAHDPRVAHCIFCEDVRLEIGNKLSFMGTYSADVAFPLPPPVRLQKICIVVWMMCDPHDVPDAYSIKVLAPPDRAEIAKLDASGNVHLPYPPDEITRKVVLRSIIQIADLVLTQEGFIEVIIDTNREEFRAGRLGIKFNVRPEDYGLPPSPASASEQLPSQSPPDAGETSSRP